MFLFSRKSWVRDERTSECMSVALGPRMFAAGRKTQARFRIFPNTQVSSRLSRRRLSDVFTGSRARTMRQCWSGLFCWKRGSETLPCLLISGHSKSQPLRFARKGANMDTIASQALNDLHCLEMTGKAKKRGAAEYRKARNFQH